MNKPLGLTPEQVEGRRSYLGAGDAKRIQDGAWGALWREKMGLAQPENLDDILAVQMGSFTEPFNLAWCERVTGRSIKYYSGNPLMQYIWRALTGNTAMAEELVRHPIRPWMACNLDGISTTPSGARCVIDAKHVGRSDDQMIARYTAAGTHQAIICSVDWWALSVFVGNSKHETIYQQVDPYFAEELAAKEAMFWSFVQSGEEPPDMTPAAVPRPQKVLRTVILEDDWRKQWPNWGVEMAHLIHTFAETKSAADLHAITRKSIGELLPEDVGEIRRGLFKLVRDKTGSIRMSLKKSEEPNV